MNVALQLYYSICQRGVNETEVGNSGGPHTNVRKTSGKNILLQQFGFVLTVDEAFGQLHPCCAATVCDGIYYTACICFAPDTISLHPLSLTSQLGDK